MVKALRCYALPVSVDQELLKSVVREAAPGALVQTASLEAASNESFVEMIAAQTLQAQTSGNLLARKPEIDLLLRLAGTTQIATAVGAVGAARSAGCVLIVAGEPKKLKSLERSVLRHAARVHAKSLSKRELSLVEKAALLNAVKV